jgi:hypothetical protein
LDEIHIKHLPTNIGPHQFKVFICLWKEAIIFGNLIILVKVVYGLHMRALHTQAKSHDHEIVRAQNKDCPKTLPKSRNVVMGLQV